MQSINYLKPTQGYSPALTIQDPLGFTVDMTIDSVGPAIFQLGGLDRSRSPIWLPQELTLSAITTGFTNVNGIRFRYGDPANIPTVVATLYSDGKGCDPNSDPIPTGSTPFDFTLTGSGGIVGGTKMIVGSVDAAGNIVGGTGFTVAHPSAGVYNITLTTPFTSLPIVVANLTSTATAHVCIITNQTNNSFTVNVVNTGTGFQNSPFNFVATPTV